jgi:hypothetical protein
VVMPVVTWSGGLHLVHVHTGRAHKRRPVVICVKGSSGDQGAISAQELEDPKTRRLIGERMSPCAMPTVLIPKKYGGWRMCT